MSELDEILRRSEVERVVGLKRSAIYEMISRGIFPRPVRIGARAVGWRRRDIRAWLDSRPAAGHGERGGGNAT